MSVSLAAGILFAAGVFLCEYEEIRFTVLGMRKRWRLRRRLERAEVPMGSSDERRWHIHIRKLIAGSGADRYIGSPEIFAAVSLMAGLWAGFAFYWAGGKGTAVSGALMTGVLPYGWLRIRLNSRRVSNSREGALMIRELLSNYKSHAYNMKEALQITAESLADAPHAAHLLSNLARGFNRAFTRGAMEEVLDQFRYELNTAWGDALARCILFSEVYGLRVTEALEDISRSLDDSRRVIEYANRANHESEMMMRYLTPVSYVLTIFCACRYFGFTLAKFIRFQFTTAAGLQCFLVMVFIYGLSLLVNTLMTREKMDL